MRLRVVSWNIHGCVGTDGRYDPSRVAEALVAMDADVIGLQEVDWRRAPHEGVDQFAFLAGALDMFAVAGPNLADQRGDYGNALLTRLPVMRAQRIDLSYAAREARGAIDASLYHRGRTVHAVVTHLGLKDRERREQVATIRASVEAAPAADVHLLMGDMNEWFPLRPVTAALTPEAYPAMVKARSFPARFPLLALDRILIRPRPASIAGGAVRTELTRVASDHLPVLAELTWPDPTPNVQLGFRPETGPEAAD